MQKVMKFIALALIVVMVCAFGGAMAQSVHISPLAGVAIAVVLFSGTLLLPTPLHTRGVASNGIQKEIWTNFIDENLYKDNAFLLETMDHSEYVDNLTVHSPQAGDDGVVTVNLNVFPATATQRTDVTKDWNINEFYVLPWRISNAEEVELSYNKMESMLYSRRATLDQQTADYSIAGFAPTGTAALRNEAGTNNNLLRSTGITNNDPNAAVAYTAANANSSATGYRLNFGLYDIRQMKKLFDSQNVPAADRHMLLSANAIDQIISDIIVSKYRDSVSQFNLATGEVGNLMGFKIHTRATAGVYNNAGTPVIKAYGAAGAADDNDSIIAWHKMSLRRAQGETIIYEDKKNPLWYGDLYSMLRRFGCTIGRNDEVGVGAIVQAAYVPGAGA